MIQLITKTQFEQLITSAQTETMIKQNIDISDPCLITPLEELANQYPEIAEKCNQILLELIKQQMTVIFKINSIKIINEF